MRKRETDEALVRAQAELIRAKTQKVDAYGRLIKAAAEPIKAIVPLAYVALVIFVALWARDFLTWVGVLGGAGLATWMAKTAYAVYRHQKAIEWAARDREPALPGTELSEGETDNND